MALSGSITTSYWTSSDLGQTRGYTLSWTATQSIANNQSTISWTLSTAGSYKYTVAERTLYVVLAGVALVNKTDRVMRGAGTVASGSFTVGHDSSGNCSISGSIQAAVYTSSVNCTGSGSWSLNNIPRQANITGAPNFNDEQNPTITYSNPAGTAVTSLQACISLTGAKSDIAYRDISKTGTSYTFNLTEAERNVLRNATLSGSNSRTVVFFVRTTIGGNTFHSTSSKTFTVINNKPTIEPTVKDVNPKTLAITNDENVFIRYHSNAEVSVNAKAYKNASITARKVICGSQNIATDTGVISKVDSGNFVFSATDSRGNTVSDSKQVTFIEYIKLTCDLLAKAPTTDGDLSFAISGNYYNNSFGTTDNELVVEYCYSENGGEYSEWIALDGVTFADNKYSVFVIVEGLDYRSSYVVKARARDKLMEVQTESKSLKAIPVCDWGENDFNFNVPVTIQGINVGNTLAELNSNLTKLQGIHNFTECRTSIATDYNGSSLICFYQNDTDINLLNEEIATFSDNGLITINQDMTALVNINIVGSTSTSTVGRLWISLVKYPTQKRLAQHIIYSGFATGTINIILNLKKGDTLGLLTYEPFRINTGLSGSYIQIMKL